MNIYIHASCRNPDLIDATELVFKTLRVGFPTYKVKVDWQTESVYNALKKYAPDVELDYANAVHHSHWLQRLIYNENKPFIVCDTDIVFHSNMESWFDMAPMTNLSMVGRYIPSFFEKTCELLHKERLHTCLMYINPQAFREEARLFSLTNLDGPINLDTQSFVHQLKIPARGGPIFYDTMALAYHAFEHVKRFASEIDACFDHLNCGTYSDLCQPTENFYELSRKICANPTLAKGIKEQQDQFYAEHTYA